MVLGLVALPVARAGAAPSWAMHAGNARHTALSNVGTQSFDRIAWQTPVDLHPQYSGSGLFIHYGSPVITAANTVVVPVKTGVADSFRVEAHRGLDGTLLWLVDSAYQLPPHEWAPS